MTLLVGVRKLSLLQLAMVSIMFSSNWVMSREGGPHIVPPLLRQRLVYPNYVHTKCCRCLTNKVRRVAKVENSLRHIPREPQGIFFASVYKSNMAAPMKFNKAFASAVSGGYATESLLVFFCSTLNMSICFDIFLPCNVCEKLFELLAWIMLVSLSCVNISVQIGLSR